MLTSEASRAAARKEAAAKRALGEERATATEQEGGAEPEGGVVASQLASQRKLGVALTLTPGGAASQLASQLEGGVALHLTPGRSTPIPNPGEEASQLEVHRCGGSLAVAAASPEASASRLASQLEDPALTPVEKPELEEDFYERSCSERQVASPAPSRGGSMGDITGGIPGGITGAQTSREADVREACPLTRTLTMP